MPTKKPFPASEIYQLKITLLGTDPPIWRRLLVPPDMTLEHLHLVLQVAMGWDESHLHEFHCGGQIYGPPNPEEAWFDLPPTISERKVRLADVMGRARARLVYIYDMGDSWEHAIVLEKRLTADPQMTYPVCVAGERACPPEDCGGIPGFYHLLEAFQDPQHEDHAEQVRWVGAEWDPEAFSIEAVNRVLQPARRRSK